MENLGWFRCLIRRSALDQRSSGAPVTRPRAGARNGPRHRSGGDRRLEADRPRRREGRRRRRGRGDARARSTTLDIDGTVVIGEGERDEAPMLYIGEKVGGAPGNGPKIDIALDPLEGTTITAKAGPNALAVLAAAEEGCLLNAPDVYMDKLAVGPGYPDGRDRPRQERRPRTSRRSPRPRASQPDEIIVCVLDRPRHAELIAELRGIGCGIQLIPDGDVAGRDRDDRPGHHDRPLHGLGRRARRRARGGGAALRRRPVQRPAAVPQRRRTRPRRANGASRTSTASTSSRTSPRATASSPPPASPTARCSTASSAAAAAR